jgi:hypothetical protein
MGGVGIGNDVNVMGKVKFNGAMFNPLNTSPAGPSAGEVYYDNTLNVLRCFDGSSWRNMF